MRTVAMQISPKPRTKKGHPNYAKSAPSSPRNQTPLPPSTTASLSKTSGGTIAAESSTAGTTSSMTTPMMVMTTRTMTKGW